MNVIFKDMEAKEKWIDETMESLEGIRSVQADPALRASILGNLSETGNKKPALSDGMLIRIAATVALLVTLNILAILFYAGNGNTQQSSRKSMATEYFSYFDTAIL